MFDCFGFVALLVFPEIDAMVVARLCFPFATWIALLAATNLSLCSRLTSGCLEVLGFYQLETK